ncbi:endonuclease domain-containing protein [Microbacterium elymi]|uniref:Endonuclease domain-containing protein n=1 Tax=Microbacterium elymi TaxID=2909587 RepID=A0ABY5NLW2_9MICO|nr:endonuclease domain-containing protein [Microbacterium elymi]UUT36104.1 endonuclease domain-containing protein [Microbacterium elymi]
MLWDAPVPRGLLAADRDPEQPRPAFDPDVLEVGVFWPDRAPRGAGIRGHAIRPGLVWTVTHPVSGLRLTSPASTWAMLAGQLPHPYDLVAIADHFVRVQRPPHSRSWEDVPPPSATIDQLAAAVHAGRRRGITELRDALARVRTGAASRTETWTRLTLVDAGLPEPVLDHDVFDSHGRFVARVDMAYPEWKIAIEYDGTHHNDGQQWEHDVDRLARLEDEGWRVIRVTRTLLFAHPATMIARVRAAIAQRTR